MRYTNYAPATSRSPTAAAGCALPEGPPPSGNNASLPAADAAAGNLATYVTSRAQLQC